MPEIEKRAFKTELRANKTGKFYGYVAKFNEPSVDMGFIERLAPGCFTNALKTSDARLLFNHNESMILGRESAGTLTLTEDDVGLYFENTPPDTTLGRDLRESIKRGDIREGSFSFTVAKETWSESGAQRTIEEVGELYDAAIVVNPAYPSTEIHARSQEKNKMEHENNENYARKAIERGIELPDPNSGDIQLTKDEADKKQFRSLGDQMQAVRGAAMPGARVDNRLYAINQRAATGLSEGIPSDGGFLLQPDYSKDIFKNLIGGNPLVGMVKTYNLTSNSLKIPAEDETSRADGSRHGGVQAYWIAEAGEKQASTPKFRQMELQLNKLVVLCYTTDELLQDASALDSYLREVAADEIGFKVQDGIINGSGAGQLLGIVNSGAMVTIDKEAGQAASTVVWENIPKMWTRMPARNRKNAIWLINQDIEPQLFSMSLAVGTGGSSVYMPAGGASDAPYASLLGRPVVPVEQCQTLGTKGDIILWDPTSYILAQKASGIQADVSIHVAYVTDQSCYRFVYRCDGQPNVSNPVTPKNGTNTLSPMVCIETRS